MWTSLWLNLVVIVALEHTWYNMFFVCIAWIPSVGALLSLGHSAGENRNQKKCYPAKFVQRGVNEKVLQSRKGIQLFWLVDPSTHTSRIRHKVIYANTQLNGQCLWQSPPLNHLPKNAGRIGRIFFRIACPGYSSGLPYSFAKTQGIPIPP